MKNYFIIHGSFGNSNEHYLPWLKKELEKQGEVICVDFPIGVGIQCYESWAKTLDKYKQKITKDSIFIGRSIGPVFAIKYLIQNNKSIDRLVSISGFNNYLVGDKDYDSVNSSMFLYNLADIKKSTNRIFCIVSENDPYVKLDALISFANTLGATTINIKDGGHFNSDSGYGEKFQDLLDICSAESNHQNEKVKRL